MRLLTILPGLDDLQRIDHLRVEAGRQLDAHARREEHQVEVSQVRLPVPRHLVLLRDAGQDGVRGPGLLGALDGNHYRWSRPRGLGCFLTSVSQSPKRRTRQKRREYRGRLGTTKWREREGDGLDREVISAFIQDGSIYYRVQGLGFVQATDTSAQTSSIQFPIPTRLLDEVPPRPSLYAITPASVTPCSDSRLTCFSRSRRNNTEYRAWGWLAGWVWFGIVPREGMLRREDGSAKRRPGG